MTQEEKIISNLYEAKKVDLASHKVEQFNVPAQLDDSIKKLIDLGIVDKANELKSRKETSLKKASEYNKIYQSLK